MKNPFRSIELQLESLFEGTTGLFSKRTGLMARILSGILRALEEQSHPGPGDVWLAPNRFSVRLGKKTWSALESPKETTRILEQKIQDHLRQS